MAAPRTLGNLAFLLGCSVLFACSAQRGAPPPTPGAGAPAPIASTRPAPGPKASAAPGAESPAKEMDPAAYSTIVDSPDRDAADRALDPGRHPAELLAFFRIAPGQKVAEIGAGGGYMSELLARSIGWSGKVYGQNSRFMLERFAEKPWTARLEKPLMKNVVRVDRDFDDPLPPEVRDLDAALIVLFYHDTVWLKVDRERMNRAIFAALKPGGVYGIVDHASREGAGTADAETLHRIEETVVKKEVLLAGFRLDREADFLRNPNDPRDWNASPRAAGERRGTSDRFVLRFVKP